MSVLLTNGRVVKNGTIDAQNDRSKVNFKKVLLICGNPIAVNITEFFLERSNNISAMSVTIENR